MKGSNSHLPDRRAPDSKTNYLVHLFQNRKVMAEKKKKKEGKERKQNIHNFIPKTNSPEICLEL